MKVLVVLFTVTLATEAFAGNSEGTLTLQCDGLVMTLMPGEEKVLVGDNEPIIGTLDQTDYFYYVTIPLNPMSAHSRNEFRYKINRLTGDYSYERGEAFEGTGDWKPIRRLGLGSGKCVNFDKTSG
jgi:hypothetical protein